MYSIKYVILMLFILFSVMFSSAIPETFKPYSLADIILISLSPILILYYNEKIVLLVILGFISFLLSSLFGDLRGFNVSLITSASLIAKWTGALVVYLAITNNLKPGLNILIFVTLLQIIVFFAVMFDLKPLPESYYGGATGIFQASADGGYYVLCFLGLFLHVLKKNSSKIIYFNIILASLTLVLVDSRFAFILGLAALVYSLLLSKARVFLVLFTIILLLLILLDFISIPPKLLGLMLNTASVPDLFNSDMSMLIRIYNFEEAFKLSDYWTGIIGNGGKFFQLTSTIFFDNNASLDNSYLYLLLSFGVIGLFVFYMIFVSNVGMGIGSRGILTFIALTFPVMQDIFSNSFNLLTLAIIVAFDTIMFKYSYELNFHASGLNCFKHGKT